MYIANNDHHGRASHYGAYINGNIYDFDGKHLSFDSWIKTFTSNENLFTHNLGVKHGICPINRDIPFDNEVVLKLVELLVKANNQLNNKNHV